MIAEDLVYCGFACPQVGLDPSFLEMLVVEHARQTVETFTERHRSRLESCGAGLVSLFTAWLQGDETFKTVWDPAFGGVFAALLNEVDNIDQRAGALALRLHECGRAGEWDLRLQEPVYFRFDRWLLPLCDAIQVTATGREVLIRTGAAGAWHNTTFEIREDEWHADAPPLPLLKRAGSRLIILPPEVLQTWEFSDLREQLDGESPEPLISGCLQGIGLIADHAPVYLDWINRVLRYLVPWKPIPNQFPSGSSSLNCAPGVIAIGNNNHSISLADTLIHEATHHYYYILGKLGALDDGTDSALYFNPFLDMNRPVSRILLAYHAFANILLFCRAARANGLADDPYLIGREEMLVPRLGVLEQGLQTTKALTTLGRALWEPLYEQVHG